MENLLSSPLDVWSAGDAWPEESPAEARRRQQRRQARRPEPPPLSLGLGPFSFSVVPRSQIRSRPLRWLQGANGEPAGGVAPAAAEGEPAAAGAPAERPSAAVDQLRAAVAELEPEAAQKLAPTGEVVDDAFFARWHKARGGSVEAAAAGIAAHAAWRPTFVGPAGRILEESIPAELAARKAYLQGHDNQGCPVVVVQAARHDMGQRDLAQTKRLIVYTLDAACATADTARNPAGQIVCLFDLSGLRPRNLDAKALLAIFELLQKHYPERLNSLYFLNAPFLFWGVWSVVSPFVHAATRRKIHFIGARGAGRRQLTERIPAEVLPAQYGGAAELVPVEAAAAAGSASGTALAGAAALQRRAGAAAHATRRFLSHKVVRPVRGAAAGAARTLRRHHSNAQAHFSGGGEQQLSEQQRRSLLAQVMLTHVLLVGLLLRMLQRVLGSTGMRRAPEGPAQHGQQEEHRGSPLPPKEEGGLDADSTPDAAAAGAGSGPAQAAKRGAAAPAGPVLA